VPITTGRSIQLAFSVPFGLYIFRGHFPTVPIVPGAVLTGWVTELAREHCGWQYGASNVTMLKFRRIVQPGLTYELQIDVSAEGSTLDFHIRLEGMTCALGSLLARPHDDR
jgi:3-hydroxymyristoyl/3-hydroxydecanoyl-(acyl carrier protein) dehydratase